MHPFLRLSKVIAQAQKPGLDRKSQMSIIGRTRIKALKEESSWGGTNREVLGID
jgi:hypothetical protein